MDQPSNANGNTKSVTKKPEQKNVKTPEQLEKELQNEKALMEVIQDVLEKPSPTGRPSVLTPMVVRKLIAAFSVGMNDTIACHRARISRDAFYDHLKKNERFSDIIQDAKDSVLIKAGQTVVRIIESGDDRVAGPLSFKMLERRVRDLYGSDNNVVIQNNIAYKPPSWFTNPDEEVMEGEEVVVTEQKP